MASDTTSRGARSASGCTPRMTRSPAASISTAPSPRTASVTSGRWPVARAGPQHGRVELHELDVGERRAGAQRHRQTVGGGDVRVGGGRVQMPGAAGGQHDRGRPDQPDPAVGRQHGTARGPDRDPSSTTSSATWPASTVGSPAARQQRPFDLGAGGVAAGVDDPVRRCARPPGCAAARPAPASKRGAALRSAGRPHPVRRPGSARPRPPVAQPAAGDQGVRGRARRRCRRRRARRGPPRRRPAPTTCWPRPARLWSPPAPRVRVRGVQARRSARPPRCRRRPRRRVASQRGAADAHSPPPARPMAIIRSTAPRARAAMSGSTTTSSRISSQRPQQLLRGDHLHVLAATRGR